jgi:MOSC domain-containing protein YiiM
MKLLSISTGRVSTLSLGSGDHPRKIVSGIRKQVVSSLEQPNSIVTGTLGLAGDEQADQIVHGGFDKAVYLYPSEHYAFWNTICEQAKRSLPSGGLAHGAMGENLTTQGLLESQLWVGDRVEIGECEFFVTAPRAPCHKFNIAMGFSWAVKMMWQSGYSGVYLSVIRPGKLAAGDSLRITPGDRVLTIAQAHQIRAKRELGQAGQQTLL